MRIGAYLFIIVGGLLQAAGGAMNAQLFRSLKNPWLASLISFVLIVCFFLCAWAIFLRPLPETAQLEKMPWWAPLGGLVGAVAVYAGLTLVGEVGAGVYTGLSVTACLISSLILDHFGWLNLDVHPCGAGRLAGAALMICGVALISKF